MRSITALWILAAAALAALFAGCSVDVAGAPCETDQNCPTGQVCGEGGTCGYSKGATKDVGGIETDAGKPPADGGKDAALTDGPADTGHPDDAATDAGGDDIGGGDAMPDDAATDAGSDTGTDAGTDAGGDAGTDGGTDGGIDAGFYCITDNDCGGAHCCVDGCAPAQKGCCNQQHCVGTGEGIFCKDMLCQCRDDWDCPGTERICDMRVVPPACVDGCTNAKCGAGKVCCGINCFDGECCIDKDCAVPGKPACEATTHRCTDACKPGGKPCGPGFLCCTDTCKKGNCCLDGDCAQNPSGKFCVNNTCATKCTADSNCPGGKCCTKGPFTGSCYTGDCCDDIQCPLPDTCSGGGTPHECGCTAESKVAFCTRMGKTCGGATGKDNCGGNRTEDCGTCQGCTSLCDSGSCHPVPHANVSCDGGDVWWFDSCWTKETMKTDCTPAEVCIGAACCLPESDAQFCARLGKDCNSVTGKDNCGTTRTAGCGGCQPGWTCGLHQQNVCGCDDDGTACAGRVCGTATNNCGAVVSCGGMCPMNDDCCDGKCVNLQTDRLNCLACGQPCAWDEACLSGCAPVPWENPGGPVNPASSALAHALTTNGTNPYVAWVGVDAVPDGGMQSNAVLTHTLTMDVTTVWKQVGEKLSAGPAMPQSVVDIQLRNGVPHVLLAETMSTVRLKVFNGNIWTDGTSSPYSSPCSVLSSLSLAPLDLTSQPTLTLTGAGGCGMGVGYAYWNSNLSTWWQTPQPPAVMPGLITMSGSGNSDLVHDGTRAYVVLSDKDIDTTQKVFVRYWNTSLPPGSWTNLGGPLSTGAIPSSGASGGPTVSMALDGTKVPWVAFVQTPVQSYAGIFVKKYNSAAGTWVQVGPDRVSGTGTAGVPSIAIIDGTPYVAYVEIESGNTGVVHVRRWFNGEWQRVGAALNTDRFSSASTPQLAGAGKTPWVAFRQDDPMGGSRIYVVRFIAPSP